MPRIRVAEPSGPHKAFALRFRQACKNAELPTTLKGLAGVFGVAAPTVHEWRHGEKLPGAENLALIAEKTRCSYDWLATGRGSENPPPGRATIELAIRIERSPDDVQEYIKAILQSYERLHHIGSPSSHHPPHAR